MTRLNSFLKYLKLLKIAEVFEIVQIFKGLNYTKETKALVFITYYIGLIFVFLHFFACLYWFTFLQNTQLAAVEPIWSNPFEYGSLTGSFMFEFRKVFEAFDNDYDPSEPRKGSFWVVAF